MIPEQAGIRQINLYERKGLSIIYESGYYISVSSSGVNYTIESCQFPTYEMEFEKAENNKLRYVYKVGYSLNDLSIANINTIAQLNKSIYGYCVELVYNNGKSQLLNTVFKPNDTSIDGKVNHVFNMSLENKTKSLLKPIEKLLQSPNFLTVDNDTITVDSTNISVDQITL